MSKKEKIKELWTKFRDAWRDPRKKAGIKLLIYVFFFLILVILSTIANSLSNIDDNNKYSYTTTTIINDNKYNDKKNILLTDKYNIKYEINYDDKEYIINGILENNVVNGYLEYDETLEKIKLNDTLVNNSTNDNIELFNVNFIRLDYIFDLLKDKSFILDDKDDNKVYTYNIDNENIIYNIVIYSNQKNVYKIEIKYDNNKYIMNFDVIE